MNPRVVIAALSFTAVGLAGLAGYESYVGDAMRPLPGDVPTYGLGSTRRADGSAVQMGDKITPPAAIKLAVRDVMATEGALKECFGDVKLHSWELDAFVSLGYNVGARAVCNSSIPDKLKAEDYAGACKTILDFDKFRDRSKPKVQNPRTGKWEYPLVRVRGLTIRRQAEYKTCIGPQ